MIHYLEDFGPAADGLTLETAVFQRAIDAVTARGGGTLWVGPGSYLVGGLLLRSNLRLWLDAGAVLIMSENYEDFTAHEALTVAELSQHALLYARDAHDVTIAGPGRIFGSADAYFASTPDAQGYRLPKAKRPRVILLENCERVRLTDFTIEHAPMWTIHLVSSRNITVTSVTVGNDLGMSNTDALNVDSCRQVHITNCNLSAADDGICIKTGPKPEHIQGPAKNIVISNCTLRSTSCALKIGTETFADIDAVTVSNCVIYESNRGIGIFSRDGGSVRNVLLDGIVFDCGTAEPAFWGKADPVFVSARRRHPAISPGVIENVHMSRLCGTAEGAINLHAEELGMIRDVSFRNVKIAQVESDSAEQGLYDIRPPVNSANPTGTGLDNAYLVDATGHTWGVRPYPGGLPVLYSHNVENLRVDDFAVTRPVPLPRGWNAQEIVMT